MVLSVGDRFGDSEAVVDGSLRLTFAELVDRVRSAAGAFAELGVQKGDRVAIWAPNSAEWMIAAFGLLTAGGVVVPVNTRFKAHEAADIITRSGAKAVLVQKGFLGLDYTAPAGVPVIDLKSDFLESGSPFEREVDGLKGSDVADIIFTSGTTGRPKGVMTSHQQNLRLYAEWTDLADLRPGDRYLIVNPFFHTFGYKAGCIASMIRGATVLPMPVLDIDRLVDLVERERITMLPGPPTLYHSLLEVAQRRGQGSDWRPCAPRSPDRPTSRSNSSDGCTTNCRSRSIMTGYGLTEAGTVTASRRGDSFEDIATTVGKRLCRHGIAYRRRRRVAGSRLQRHEGLPRRSRRHRRGDRRRRLAAHRRSGHHRRRRPGADRRPQEGHVHRRRLQRLPGRDRGLPAGASRRRAGRGDRCARRAPRTGGQGLRGVQGGAAASSVAKPT